MRLVLIIPILMSACGAISHAAILDRIGVTVGKQVITEGAIILDLRVDAFLDQTPVDLSGDQKRKAAARLVDQSLILQEAILTRVPLPTEEDAGKMLEQVKSRYSSDGDYNAALAADRITETDVRAHLLDGLRAMRFTDFRFRPEIQISENDLRDYYKTLAAQWQKENPGTVQTYEASHDQIEKLLTEDRITQALDRWLATQRAQTQIIYRDRVFQ
jgi:hypothetical protein